MPFWDQQHAVQSPSLNMAIGCLGAYGVVSAGYVAWVAMAIGCTPTDFALGGVRILCAIGLGWALMKRQKWARMVGLGAGVFGGLGLVGLGMALANVGVASLPLGVITAGYGAISAVCLSLVGIHLARVDAREAFEPQKMGAALAPLTGDPS